MHQATTPSRPAQHVRKAKTAQAMLARAAADDVGPEALSEVSEADGCIALLGVATPMLPAADVKEATSEA
jgi:hypothetical protein